MKKTKKIVMSMILGIIVITIVLCLSSKNISAGTMTLILFFEILLLISFFVWISNKERKKCEEQERLKIEQKEAEERQEKLDSMTETDLLTWNGRYDLIVEGNSFEEYRKNFAPFNQIGKIFPAIDKEFEKKLQEKTPTKLKIREFSIKRDGMTPAHYFDSFERDPIVISLSADNIMEHFDSNIGHRGETNWYLWNTEPNKEPNIGNVRIITIQCTGEKFYLYSSQYSKLPSMGLNYIGKIEGQKFFVPVP